MPRIGLTHTCRNFDVIRDWAFKKRYVALPLRASGPYLILELCIRVPGLSHFHRVVDGVIEDYTPEGLKDGKHVHRDE